MWALVPVKTLSRSKQRLAGLLSAPERAELSLAMLEDLLSVLESVAAVTRIMVLTDDARVAETVRGRGHAVVQETSQLDVNANLNRAARRCATRVSQLLVMPADLPAVSRADIQALLASHRHGVTMAPATVDGGTNALLLEPPDAVPFQFGARSCAAHRAAAVARGLDIALVRRPALGRDMDRPADLGWLLTQPAGTRTAGLLARLQVLERLAAAALKDTA